MDSGSQITQKKKVRDLSTNAKTTLKEKKSYVVYNIPCKCGKYSYTGETDRKFSEDDIYSI